MGKNQRNLVVRTNAINVPVIYYQKRSPMWKPIFLLSIVLLYFSSQLQAQCLTAPSPPSCTGTEALATDNETINAGVEKWYYGSATTFNSLTMNGGTLTVCGDLTVDKFYMDSGTIYVRPGGRFVIGSGIGAGLILKGNSYFYNYGTFEVQRNLSLDNGWASPAKPNIVFNAISSTFSMANQYLVINNADSWFVNNGASSFWGIITDPMSSAGSVCLGNGSTTRMSILINKVANTYTVPVGAACVYVNQWSQFYGKLTSDSSLYACLGSGHSSDAGCVPFGCTPNNWGAAHVLTNCAGCAAISVLAVQFTGFSLTKQGTGQLELEWQVSAAMNGGTFRVLRSADGRNFLPIDSISVTDRLQTVFQSIDNHPQPGENFYMINYIDPSTGKTCQSQMARATFETISIYPSPFTTSFFIRRNEADKLERLIITDVNGQNVAFNTMTRAAGITEVLLSPQLPAGIYLVHMLTRNNVTVKTIMKR